VTSDSGRAHHQLWGGRFTGSLSDAAAELNRSLPVDRRLWRQDVRVAQAWVSALAVAGIIDPAEERTLADGLSRVAERLADGADAHAPDEDVHTLVERLLYEEVGEIAGKLNTGRSRNDQVATDLRLWCLEAAATVRQEVTALATVLAERASSGIDVLLPGYTHGQRAQPVRWAYVLLAHVWPLVRDLRRLNEVSERTGELPLGAGAVAGSFVPIDRERLRETLGFRRIAANSLDVTGDRDFVADFVHALAMVSVHVSRLCGEFAVYTSSEYGFVRLDDAYSTGSSLLPQKRNPDIFELARAKSARVVAALSGLLNLLRGLPAGYSKDLQEDKAFLFDAVDTLLLTLPAVRGAIETLQPVPDRMRAALSSSLLATDLADGLTGEGVPFREAHALVGKLVRRAEAQGVELRSITEADAAALHPALPRLIAALGAFEDSVERRRTVGGASREAVAQQLREVRSVLATPGGTRP
jgi:argininosuccinate lyase